MLTSNLSGAPKKLKNLNYQRKTGFHPCLGMEVLLKQNMESVMQNENTHFLAKIYETFHLVSDNTMFRISHG
jgi:hypothetical protein